MALLDVKGRALDLPVHSLLGGALTHEVTLNAWIGTVAPEQAAREATEWLRRGFVTAKIKVSGAGPEGIARVAAVRAAVGDRMELRVDFNESLTLAESVRVHPAARAVRPDSRRAADRAHRPRRPRPDPPSHQDPAHGR